MKYSHLFLGLVVGGALVYIWNKNRNKKNPNEIVDVAIAEVKAEEKQKYSAPFNKKYNIVMPSDLVSKKVRAKAKQLTEGRYEVDLNKLKEPVSI